MNARMCLMVAVLGLGAVLAGVAQAGDVVYTYKYEVGQPFDLPDTSSQANAGPSVVYSDGATQWIDTIWGGSADFPPNNQFVTTVIKPDLSLIAPGNVANVEYRLNVYRSEFSSTNTVALARIMEDNNLAEVSMDYRTTGTGVPDPSGGTGVQWSGFGDGFPFITVDRDGGGAIIPYGEGSYDTNISTAEVVSGQKLTDFVNDVVNGNADYYGFVVYDTGAGNIGWCGSNNVSGFCGSPNDGVEPGEFNHSFTVIVPEPAGLALLGIGGALAMIRRRGA